MRVPVETPDTDGTATERADPLQKAVVGGFSVVDAPALGEAIDRAGKIAVAGRRAREVLESGPDDEV